MKMFHLFIGLLFLVGCNKSDDAGNNANGETKWPEQPALPTVSGNATFNLSSDEEYLNIMEETMPRMPLFPRAKQKELKLTGYVADLKGKPLQGAYIGLRSAGTVYIAASAETDANGYYEMQVPLGGADIYAAGYTINYGTGGAAMSLYPTDGQVALSNPSGGVVKNFVLLSYGLADENKRAAEPWSPLGYFGGSLRLCARPLSVPIQTVLFPSILIQDTWLFGKGELAVWCTCHVCAELINGTSNTLHMINCFITIVRM